MRNSDLCSLYFLSSSVPFPPPVSVQAVLNECSMNEYGSIFELVVMLRMSEGREEMEDAIDVDNETFFDPMVVRLLARLRSRTLTRATYRRVESSSETEAAFEGTVAAQPLDVGPSLHVTWELLEDPSLVYDLGARMRLIVETSSFSYTYMIH